MDAVARSRALEAEGRRLIELVARDPGVDVPTCPGWQLSDLLGHVAGGWEAFASIAESASLDPPDFGSFAPVPEGEAERLAFARDRLERIVTVMATADPDRAVWTWRGEATLAFYQRRAHLETVVHRVDAEQAAASRTPVDPAVGVDAVDELFTVLISAPAERLPSGSLHLHQTDGDGEFMLDVIEGVLAVRREHAKGDAALRATGEELMMVMWGRRSLDGLELFGDREVADQWIALAP